MALRQELRQPVRPRTGRGAIRLALVLAAAAAPAAAQETPERIDLLAIDASGRLACSGGAFDLGRSGTRWMPGPGFHPGGRGEETRRFVWADGRGMLRVPVAGDERSLRLTVLGIEDGMTLRARWNGHRLGARRIGAAWRTVVWELPVTEPLAAGSPAAASSPPPAALELAADVRRQRPPGRRHHSFGVDRLWMVPRPACAAGTGPLAGPFRDGVELAAGESWIVRSRFLPEARLILAGRGAPGARLVWAAGLPGGPWSVGAVTVDDGGSLRARAPFDECCSERGAVWLSNRGPGSVTVREAALVGDDRPAAWRRACGSWPLLAVLMGGGLALFWWLAGWTGHGARWRPWAEAAAIACLACGVRLVYLHAFPVSETTGFADSHGYLNGARMLLSDEYSLWTDTQWHAWFSWIRPPGYYLFVAWVLGPLGAGVIALTVIQAVLSSLAAAALYAAGRSLFGRGPGLVAGLWLALDPQAVTSSSWVMTETLFLALLLPGIAALAACSVRPRAGTAVLAGLVLGAAALVRSATFYYVPLAALLLVLGRREGRRRAAVPAAAMVLATLVVVAPWCVRNLVLYDTWVGIDDIALHNFLVDHPNERIVPLHGEDLNTVEGKTRYRRRVASANNDRGLTRRSGEIFGQGLLAMARSPVAEAERFGAMLRRSWTPAPNAYVGMVVGESRTCRVARLTDLRNASIIATLALGGLGMLLALRRRESWPTMLWPPFTLLAINLLFHPELRYTFTYLPVILPFAGLALARLRPRRTGG